VGNENRVLKVTGSSSLGAASRYAMRLMTALIRGSYINFYAICSLAAKELARYFPLSGAA
jgi:hypothetical protein